MGWGVGAGASGLHQNFFCLFGMFMRCSARVSSLEDAVLVLGFGFRIFCCVRARRT